MASIESMKEGSVAMLIPTKVNRRRKADIGDAAELSHSAPKQRHTTAPEELSNVNESIKSTGSESIRQAENDRRFELIHHDFWCGRTDSNTCPQCDEIIGTAKRVHYIRMHYDIYFSTIGQRKVECWMGQKLGSGSNISLTLWRICLHCDKSKDVFKGRMGLLRHIQKDHPKIYDQMMIEYKEISRDQYVKDTEIHLELIGTSTPQALSSAEVKDRQRLWKEQMLKSRTAVNVSSSQLTSSDENLVIETPPVNDIPTPVNIPYPSQLFQQLAPPQLPLFPFVPPYSFMPHYYSTFPFVSPQYIGSLVHPIHYPIPPLYYSLQTNLPLGMPRLP